jgi:hypothetical protein
MSELANGQRSGQGKLTTSAVLDANLLRIFKGFKRDAITIVIMAISAMPLLGIFLLAGAAIIFAEIAYGAILFLVNIWRTIELFRVIRQYRQVLVDEGLESTPLFERALAARVKLGVAWGVVLLLLGWALYAMRGWFWPGAVIFG